MNSLKNLNSLNFNSSLDAATSGVTPMPQSNTPPQNRTFMSIDKVHFRKSITNKLQVIVNICEHYKAMLTENPSRQELSDALNYIQRTAEPHINLLEEDLNILIYVGAYDKLDHQLKEYKHTIHLELMGLKDEIISN